MRPDLHPGDVVVLRAFDEFPEHLFRITEVYEDVVGGYSLTGPLAGEYGEPPIELIKSVQPD